MAKPGNAVAPNDPLFVTRDSNGMNFRIASTG